MYGTPTLEGDARNCPDGTVRIVLFYPRSLHCGVRASLRRMPIDDIVGLTLAAAGLAYLVFAMLRPERF
jgi:K+-transporting ATPase KdpF subunit